MNRTERATKNIMWGVLNKIVALALPFLTRTAMIYTLGTLYLGLNGLFTSILQILNISELGISSAIIFSMYKPLAEDNDEEVRELMNFYRICYHTIGIIVLILGLILLPFLNKLISGEIPSDVNIYILYLMNLGSAVLSYELFAYRTSLLIATQRNDIVSKVSSVCSICQFALQLIILILFKNYYLYVGAIILNSITNNIICAGVCKKIYPQYYCSGRISPEIFRSIKKKIGGMIFQKIGGVVLSSVDTIVISAFLGLTTLAIYQNYYYIITSLFGVLQVIMTSLTSTIGNSIVLESKEKNYIDFKKFNFIYIWIVAWCTICLLCMYQPFMYIWVGKDLMLNNSMVILFAAYFFVHKWCDMLYVYQEACGIWWETKWVPLLAAIMNLTINLILVNIIGLAGILISTIISVVLIYDTGYAKVLFSVYFKECGSLRQYICRQLFYLSGIIVAAVPTFMLCNSFLCNSSLLKLLINGIICAVVPNIIFLVIWNKLYEFNDTKILIKQILSRKLKKQ